MTRQPVNRLFASALVALLAISVSASPGTDCPTPVSPRLTRTQVTDWAIRTLVAALPDAALTGQLIVMGIERDRDGRPILALDDATRGIVQDVQPGAAVFFGQTFAGIDQVVALVRELHDASAVPPFIATDYEGGMVSRLTTTGGIPATRIPRASVIGEAVRAADAAAGPGSAAADASTGARAIDSASNSEGLRLARELGRVMGRELRSLGVTMNFAPVADVDPSGGIGAIGRHGRTFGDDPVLVGRIAGEIAIGMQEAGVAAVVKHFPGHGGLAQDSHHGYAMLEASLEDLRLREFVAFSLAFAAEPMGIMTAHLAVSPALQDGLPATISPGATRLARGELGYAGLIITDALNMRAVTEIAPERELVVLAVHAGADLLLTPLDAVAARDALLEALENGSISRERLESSVVRIIAAKEALGVLGPAWAAVLPGATGDVDRAREVLGSEEHQAVVARLVELAGGSR